MSSDLKDCRAVVDLERWARAIHDATAERARIALDLIALVPGNQGEALCYVLELEQAHTAFVSQLERIWTISAKQAYLDGGSEQLRTQAESMGMEISAPAPESTTRH